MPGRDLAAVAFLGLALGAFLLIPQATLAIGRASDRPAAILLLPSPAACTMTFAGSILAVALAAWTLTRSQVRRTGSGESPSRPRPVSAVLPLAWGLLPVAALLGSVVVPAPLLAGYAVDLWPFWFGAILLAVAAAVLEQTRARLRPALAAKICGSVARPWFVGATALVALVALRIPPTPLIPTADQGSHYLAGDEPSYYLIADSLARDRDTDLSNNIAAESWVRAGTAPTMGHSHPGTRGGLYSVHRPGMPLLILPAYVAGLRTALTPRGAVTLFVNLLAAAAALLVFVLSKRMTESPLAALAATLALVATLPYVAYAGQAYPEIGAAACTAAILLALHDMRTAWARWTAPLLIAWLPWFHERFAVLALAFAALYVAHARKRLRGTLMLAVPCAISWGALAFCFVRLYGTPWPNPGDHPSIGWHGCIGFLGIYLDAAHGLVPCNPLYLLIPLGILLLLRRTGRRGLAFLAPAAAYYLLIGVFHDWWGGFSPPARYMVVLVPFAAPLLALAARERPLLALILGWTAVAATTLAHALPELVYRHANVFDRSVAFFHPGRFFPAWLRTPDNPRLYVLSLVWIAIAAWAAVIRGTARKGSRCLATAPAILFGGAWAAVVAGEWATPVPSYRNDASVLRLWTEHAARPSAPVLATGDNETTYLESGIVFEAETAVHPSTALRTPDPLAVNHEALFARSTEPGRTALLWGQYASLPRGSYEARFRIRPRAESPSARLILDVIAEGGRRSLARTDVACETLATDAYSVVTVPFALDSPGNRLEFRVHAADALEMWIDRITVHRRIPSR